MLKLSENPPVVTPGVESVQEFDGCWAVAHTKARFEKALAWDLLQAGVKYFLPLTPRTKFSGGRKRKMLMPLFPGYLFFCGSPDDKLKVYQTDRVCSVIPVPNQHELIAELASLEKGLRGDAELDFYPFAAVGKRCRVTSGPFMGMEGIVVRRTERATLVLQIAILGRGASLELDLDILEPVDDDAPEHDTAGAAQGLMYKW